MVVVRDRPPSAVGRGGALEARLELVKLEASGNDFLVVHAGETWPEPQDEASRGGPVRGLLAGRVRALCDRHRGIGADGVIAWRRLGGERRGSSGAGSPALPGAGSAAGADLEMVLWNADGSRAEMSGNGIRCLVHAAVLGGAVPPGVVRVSTDAGVRTVEYEPADAPGATAYASVDMGVVTLGPEVDCPWPNVRARGAEVGNPHLVLVGDVELSTLDVPAIVAFAESANGGPVNVEVVRPGSGSSKLELRVFERGVGETAACGTGSCAAALVARSLGALDPASEHVVVESSGGHLDVRLGALDSDPVVLAGPVRKIAEVVVEPDPGTHARRAARQRS